MKMDPTQRRELILEAALSVARIKGIAALTFRDIAEACEVTTSPATVRRYGKRIGEIQRAVIQRANVQRVPEAGKIAEDARKLKITVA
jgi:AcrR family transcriptional regulator